MSWELLTWLFNWGSIVLLSLGVVLLDKRVRTLERIIKENQDDC
jgi:hypothetical protein